MGADIVSSSRSIEILSTFELKEHTFDKHKCVTIAEAPGVAYEELGDFIGEKGYFSMIFDFRYADLDIASGSEWFKRIPWTVRDLRDKIMTSQAELQKHGWGANFIEDHDLRGNVFFPAWRAIYLSRSGIGYDELQADGYFRI